MALVARQHVQQLKGSGDTLDLDALHLGSMVVVQLDRILARVGPGGQGRVFGTGFPRDDVEF